MKKVLIISSPGGHWIQAQRLIPAFENCHLALSSTYSNVEEALNLYPYFKVTDFNRNNMFGIFKTLKSLYIIDKEFRPDLVVSTGAAPGLLAGFYWRLKGRRTVWIDSIANSESISLSGKIASYFFNETLTQWPYLQNKRVKFYGRVL